LYKARILDHLFGFDLSLPEKIELHTVIMRAIKSRRWAGHVALMGDRRGAYSVLGRRPEGKRKLGRPSRRWEDNITSSRSGMGRHGVD
jgi:hypothetical protein